MNKYIKIILSIVGIILLSIVIDVICVFNISRPIFAIREDNGDSVNIIYRGLFFDTYNCMEYSMAQIKSKGSKFNCLVSYIGNESRYNVISIDNVSIDIFDVSNSGATIIIKDTNKTPYVYGSWYKLEKLVDGKWYDVPTIIEDYGFDEMAYLVNEDNEVKFVINWDWLYGKLSSGSYRLLKQVSDKYIAIPFSIETNSNKIIEVVKTETINLNKFNIYLKRDNKVIYLASNIEEVYFSQNSRMTLKNYISKAYQTIDDSMDNLIANMELVDTLKDGGTKIYKYRDVDLTIIKCNTVSGNRDYFIGDYSMNYDSDSMCRQ